LSLVIERNMAMKKYLSLILLMVFCISALTAIVVRHKASASPVSTGQGHGSVVKPDAVKWTPRSPGLELAVLSGNPAKDGDPFVIRLKLRDGLTVPPHWHPIDEHLTVLTGTLHIGMG
jgi:hypothetical protein